MSDNNVKGVKPQGFINGEVKGTSEGHSEVQYAITNKYFKMNLKQYFLSLVVSTYTEPQVCILAKTWRVHILFYTITVLW